MGQTGFCKILRFPVVFCGNLRFLRKSAPPKCRKFQEKQKTAESAKICEKLRIWFSLSLLIPSEVLVNVILHS